MKSVLVVCVGNICRSPMAEGLLKLALPKIEINSAGTGALIGQRADPAAVELMAEKGVDLSGHIARQINLQMCRNSELILVMSRDQRRYIEAAYPSSRGKVFLMSEASAQGVPDPYRGGRLKFEEALVLIEDGAKVWIERIKKIAYPEERQFT